MTTTFNATNDAEFDAALLLAHDRDTINLAAGNYSAEHIINHDITIMGAKGNQSQLSGGIEITHAGVTIDGVMVTGENDFSGAVLSPTGIYVTAAGATIKNTLFSGVLGNGATGLTAGSGVTGLIVTHNEFAGYDVGLFAVASAIGSVNHNAFTEEDSSVGIQTESTGLLISHNSFADAGDGGAAVLSTPTGSTNGSAFILADNAVDSILPSHAINIDVSGTGAFTVTGTAYDDAIYTADDPTHAGALTVNGLGGNDEIWGGAGNDTLTGGAGTDILHGQGGDDTFGISGTNDIFDTFEGNAAGHDTMLVTGTKGVTLNGFDAAADSIEEWQGNGHELLGTAANETFDLSGLDTVTGLTFVDGGKGDDTIIGSDAWNGDLRGGVGSDTLHGGTGNDSLDGGKDKVSDGFVFNVGDGHDTIMNFIGTKIPSVVDDHIDLTGFGTDYTTDVHDNMTQVGKNVVIDFGGGDTLTIVKTTISFLDTHQADFHLV